MDYKVDRVEVHCLAWTVVGLVNCIFVVHYKSVAQLVRSFFRWRGKPDYTVISAYMARKKMGRWEIQQWVES